MRRTAACAPDAHHVRHLRLATWPIIGSRPVRFFSKDKIIEAAFAKGGTEGGSSAGAAMLARRSRVLHDRVS